MDNILRMVFAVLPPVHSFTISIIVCLWLNSHAFKHRRHRSNEGINSSPDSTHRCSPCESFEAIVLNFEIEFEKSCPQGPDNGLQGVNVGTQAGHPTRAFLEPHSRIADSCPDFRLREVPSKRLGRCTHCIKMFCALQSLPKVEWGEREILSQGWSLKKKVLNRAHSWRLLRALVFSTFYSNFRFRKFDLD